MRPSSFGGRLPAFAALTQPAQILLSILSSLFVAGLIVIQVIVFARNGRYFLAFSPFVYVVFLVSVCHNAYFISLLIASLNRRDSAYGEYLEFRRTTEGRTGALSALITPGIQRKLIFSFVPLILVIILLMSFVLMKDFSGTVLASVIQNGRSLAERTASVIKANTGDTISTDDYLSSEAKRNASALFPFRAISFWRRSPLERHLHGGGKHRPGAGGGAEQGEDGAVHGGGLPVRSCPGRFSSSGGR